MARISSARLAAVLVVAGVVLIAVLGASVWRWKEREETAQLEQGQLDLDEAVSMLGCGSKAELEDPLEHPLRAGGAIDGLSCALDQGEVFVYLMGPVGMGGSLDYRSAFGLGDDVERGNLPCALDVVVGRSLVVVSPTELTDVVDAALDLRTRYPMRYPPDFGLPCGDRP